MRALIKKYYRLTKPGIIYGNALMYGAGFFLASRDGIAWQSFFISLLGLSLVIGAACVFNNYADREMDAKMERTRKRALVSGNISPRAALIYGEILALLGFSTLYFFSTPTAFLFALVGFATYVYLYTPMKPRTPYALYVGAVAGAMPPLVGYTAVTDNVDLWALGLFVALFLWQIPHFLAIGFKRYEEYTAAGVPLHLPRGAKSEKEIKIANQIFVGSLIVLLAGCLAIALWRLLFS
jgi:protoheme IX farnesyltransferase